MARRFFLAAFLTLFILPTVAFAQEVTPEPMALWNLNQELPVPNLGFWFLYPEGWLQDNTFGIHLAENFYDLDKALDPDNTTHPHGYIISIRADSLDEMHMQPDVKLDDAADTIINLIGLRETAVRVDVPVMTRRSVMVTADDISGRPGIFNFWIQDGYLVTFSLDGPVLNDDVRYTWGLILKTIAPTNSLVLGDVVLTSPNGDFTTQYPQGWFTDPTLPGVVIEKETDLSSSGSFVTPYGYKLSILEENLADINPDVKDLSGLGAYLAKGQGLDASPPMEQIILGTPALTYSSTNSSKIYLDALTVILRDDGNVILIGLYSPYIDGFKLIQPTYLAMLQSITSVTK